MNLSNKRNKLQKIRHVKKIMNYEFPMIQKNRFSQYKRILLFAFFILFCQLIHLQISSISEYQDKLASFINQMILMQMPRGEIRDRNGKTVVVNEKIINVTYTKHHEDDLHDQISLFVKDILQSDDENLVKTLLQRIEQSKEMKVVLAEDVSYDVAARLGEMKSDFPGFKTEIEYTRVNQAGVWKDVIGSVTASYLPLERAEYLLSLGYPMNAQTGKTGIELTYESLLKGGFSKVKSCEDGTLIPVEMGYPGYDLTLTLDLDLQHELEQVLTETLISVKDVPERKTMNQILFILGDPENGDIIAASSAKLTETGEVVFDTASLYSSSFVPGSIVKGATLYAGLSQHVIYAGEVMKDEPMKVKGTAEKSSWKNLGNINDVEALAYSSNVYMMKTAIRLGQGVYRKHQPLRLKEDVFEKLRSCFSEFGLGVKTGADVSFESSGLTGKTEISGNVLDFAIGQFDTYTMLQLFQYISTIANGGNKVAPRFVLSAQNSRNETVWRNDVITLHQLSDTDALERVQLGFELCVNEGLCKGMKSDDVSIAAKTGTSQTYAQMRLSNGALKTVSSVNNAVVAYGIKDKKKASAVCMIPNAWTGSSSQTNLCLSITKKMIESFFGNNFS